MEPPETAPDVPAPAPDATGDAPATGGPSRDAALALLALAVVLAATFSVRSVVVREDGLPAWDAAQYLVEATRYRESLLRFDVLAFLKQLTKPELHPPVHKLALGLTLTGFGNTIAVARAYPTAAWLLALGVLVLLARRLYPQAGWRVGAFAAAATALGVEEIRYVATPMTEPTALVVALGALLGALRWVPLRDARSQLKVGGLVLLAGLVRYNLPPMLLAALFAAHGLGNLGALRDGARRRELLDARVLLWVAPTVGFFLAWQLVRPELFERVRTFLTNRSSGLPFWSAENLLWVPRTLADQYVGARVPTVLLGLAWLGALWRDRAHAGRRILHAYVAVTFALLTYHDYKIDRSLTIAWPLLWLLAAGFLWEAGPPLLQGIGRLLARLAPNPSDATTRAGVPALARWTPHLALVFAGLAVLPWLYTSRIRSFAEKDDFRPEPVVREVLERLEAEGRATEQLWVTGWFFRLSPNLIEWWLRSHDVPAKLKLDQLPLLEKTRTGIDRSWDPKYAAWVEEKMLLEDVRAKTTFVTLETTPGAHFWDEWTAYGNNYARAMREQMQIPEVGRLAYVDEGLLVRIYREGGTAFVDTSDAGVNHDAGVTLPAGFAPYFRDTFGQRAASWMLVPAKALSSVQITREGSRLRISVPQAQPTLQLCGPVPANPGPFRAVLHARTEDLKGRAWLHLRGMDASGALQYVQGAPDIVQLGPLAAEAERVYERDVTLSPGATNVKLCLVLDGATGTVTLEDVALLPQDAPRLTKQQLAEVAAPRPEQAPTEPPVPGSVAPSAADDSEAPIDGEVLFREPFSQPYTGWRIEGRDAARVRLTPGDTALALTLDGKDVDARACGPAVAGAAGTRMVLRAEAHVRGNARLQLRGLTYAGRVLRTQLGEAVQELELPGESDSAEALVDLPAGVAQVRPCVVFEGASGSVTLRDLAFLLPLSLELPRDTP